MKLLLFVNHHLMIRSVNVDYIYKKLINGNYQNQNQERNLKHSLLKNLNIQRIKLINIHQYCQNNQNHHLLEMPKRLIEQV